MKHTIHKLLCLVLCAALLGAPVRVLASEALGHDLELRDTQTADGAELASGTFWSDSRSDLRRENYVVYRPGGRVRPVVSCGDTTRSLDTVPAAAKRLEEQGWRVVAGINGDYYGTQHGVPLGCTMVDGELRNANSDLYRAVGFRSDGSVVIGYPRLVMHVAVERPEPEPAETYDPLSPSGSAGGIQTDTGALTAPGAQGAESAGTQGVRLPDTGTPDAQTQDAGAQEDPSDGPYRYQALTNDSGPDGDALSGGTEDGTGTADGVGTGDGTGAEDGTESAPEPLPVPEDFDIFAFDHVRQTRSGIFLYDDRFNAAGTTGTSEPGTDVICTVLGGSLSIGGSLSLVVDEVRTEAVNTAVPAGKYVLTANDLAGDRTLAPLLALMLPGDRLTVSVYSASQDADWSGVVQMLGAPELLVAGGEVVPDLPDGSAPRTAVGLRSDGSAILYTIDGRRPGYSIGASLTAVAMRLVELGCVTAVALDGGGSTTLTATLPDETAARTVNVPSGSEPRAVTNQLFLVEPDTPSGIPARVYVAADPSRLLPGARTSLTAAVIDTHDIPMDAPVALSSDLGEVEGSVLTAPDSPGAVTVTAVSGGLSGTAEIAVLLPDTIVIRRGAAPVTSLLLSPGDSAELSAEGILDHLPLTGDDRCFTWTYEGDGVTLSEDGTTLTAGETAGAGTLTVSVGDRAVTLPVTVSVQPLLVLDDFETPFEPVDGSLTAPASDTEDGAGTGGSGDSGSSSGDGGSGSGDGGSGDGGSGDSGEAAPAIRLSYAADPAHVRLGRASARLDYSLPEAGAARLDLSYAIGSGYDRAELWVLGNGSTVSLALETDAGPSESVPLAFDGWGSVSLRLPDGAKRISGLTLSTTDEAEGELWLDQLLLGWTGAADGEPPAVTLVLDREAGTLTGRAFDAVNGAALPTLRLELDGEALDFDFDERTGALSALPPEDDGRAHILTLTAGDAEGQLARTSVYIPASELLPPAFPDLEGHWAAGAAEYLRRSGVSNGSDGLYLPDSDITRQEFATMLYRWLGLTEEDTPGDVELPFFDAEEIAPWAVEAARAMYSRGIILGGKDAMGHLLYDPRAPITRQEASTMLGRLVERGFTVPPLRYEDAEDIADWAAEHVALLASFGVFDDLDPYVFDPARPLTRGEMASLLLRLR